jgi:hypothetical protein
MDSAISGVQPGDCDGGTGQILNLGRLPETIVLGQDMADLGLEGTRCVRGYVLSSFVAPVVKCAKA